MLVVFGLAPVSAPFPAFFGKGGHDDVSYFDDARFVRSAIKIDFSFWWINDVSTYPGVPQWIDVNRCPVRVVGPFCGVLDAPTVEPEVLLALMLASSLPPNSHQFHAGTGKLVGVEGVKNAHDCFSVVLVNDQLSRVSLLVLTPVGHRDKR